MSWDSSASSGDNAANSGFGISQWGESGDYKGADLMQLLNGYYISKPNSTCTYCNDDNQENCSNDCLSNVTPLSNTAKNMIEQAVWSTRAIEYGTYTAKEMYEAERTSELTGKECTSGKWCNDSVTRTTEWEGKIGLIYPSDWGYASTGEECEDIVYGECDQNNWLYTNSFGYWMISPSDTNAITAWYFDNYCYNTTVSIGAAVRPTAYLKHDIQIIGGNGGDEPFKLSV